MLKSVVLSLFLTMLVNYTGNNNEIFFVHFFFVCLRSIGKRSDLSFSRKSDRKNQKSVVSFTHEQNSICSQKQLNDIAHEHTIICKQLFAGHVVGSLPMKRKKLLHRMIIKNVSLLSILIYTTQHRMKSCHGLLHGIHARIVKKKISPSFTAHICSISGRQ